MDLLDRKARDIAHILASVPGAADVQVKSPPGTPGVTVTLRPDRLAQLGFRPVEVLTALQTAYQGAIVAQTYEGSKVFDVAVILSPRERQDAETIGRLNIRNTVGLRVPLSSLADISTKPTRYAILHDGARRRQTITCNPNGRDVTSFVHEAQVRVGNSVQLPRGVYITYSGAAQEQAHAQREIVLHSLLAAAGIVLLLAIVFGNWRNLLLVCANLPFALVGGVLALFLVSRFGDKGQGGISLGTLVGFVTLFGITMRNSIMMISHFEHLVCQEGMTWGLETAVRGSDERLIPVLMTALVTALGVLPLALGSGEAGREIEDGMAIVILGGLVTSTALNLLVLPMLALKYGRFDPRLSNAVST